MEIQPELWSQLVEGTSEKFRLVLQMLIPSYFPTLTSYANCHVQKAFAEYASSGMNIIPSYLQPLPTLIGVTSEFKVVATAGVRCHLRPVLFRNAYF